MFPHPVRMSRSQAFTLTRSASSGQAPLSPVRGRGGTELPLVAEEGVVDEVDSRGPGLGSLRWLRQYPLSGHAQLLHHPPGATGYAGRRGTRSWTASLAESPYLPRTRNGLGHESLSPVAVSPGRVDGAGSVPRVDAQDYAAYCRRRLARWPRMAGSSARASGRRRTSPRPGECTAGARCPGDTPPTRGPGRTRTRRPRRRERTGATLSRGVARSTRQLGRIVFPIWSGNGGSAVRRGCSTRPSARHSRRCRPFLPGPYSQLRSAPLVLHR